MDFRKIVWLSSYPKSGNTWLRCFFDAYLMGKVDINNLIGSVTDDGPQRALPGIGDLDPSKFPVDVQVLTRPMAMLRLVIAFNLNEQETGLRVPLFVKTHNAHLVANGIELLPASLTKATIHVVRDPRDVLVSFAKHMGAADYDEAVEWFLDRLRHLQDARRPKMGDFISSWPLHVASFANADTHDVLVVRYEDMKARPEQVFAVLVEHAGLEPDPKRIAHALECVSLAELRKQESERGFKESSPYAKDKFFGDGATGGWRDKLEGRHVHRIEKACASMMKRYGYSSTARRVA